MLDPIFGYQIVLGASLLFMTAGLHKFADLRRFGDTVAAYEVVPGDLARYVAPLVPCAELAVAATVLWARTRVPGLCGGIVLLLVYCGGMALNLTRGRVLQCGCGSASRDRVIAGWMIWRNLGFASLLSVAALPWTVRSLSIGDGLTAVGGVAAAVILYVAIDQLLGDIAPRAQWMRTAR